MEKSQFEKAKELEQRIAELEFMKVYLNGVFYYSPVVVKVEIATLGQGVSRPFVFDPLKNHQNVDYKNTEDAQFIIQAINKRIEDLKSEFEKLLN